ncbi:NmrA family NAD(P)-binding protein [Methylobacterium gnaphalii]|uniref:NmrA family transcriptional regulator n=1 Tax=Methylobacterium gnaphalii TaxID=1010610 RepID=A0A512JGL0_9HYPH|nr:NmrA family NAD(P)-binding protein [Methylobacterium gnaphalii]GEP09066.1 NmrA family transcriptional regulator [Methylobacterium gnaphalii]GJD68378.1 NAD(P)H azoreductase [Methylobacterium gnaphalii]GLS48990.1 NmrA family transcriptional regulator [Methylobacterium gnaphalii]
MYAVMGVTGQVGGKVAERLVATAQPVRAVVRDVRKAAAWAERGCEVATADITDAAALARAFAGCAGVFIVIPPLFDPAPGFPEIRAIAAALAEALREARPGKAVMLSTIGAQATEPNLLSQLGIAEAALSALPIPIAFLRAAWFVENAAGDVQAARETGVIASYLQPLDKPVPMVAIADIGHLGADLLGQSWTGRRIVELEGPSRITPNQLAAAFAARLGRPVRAQAVARSEWESRFAAAGARNPEPRARMIDGFNEGWIEFEAGESGSLKGRTGVDEVVAGLVARG